MKKKIAYIHMLRTLLFALNEIKEFEEKFNLINQNKSITKMNYILKLINTDTLKS
ncbi:hypothetical protein [Mycoplasmopsis cynos]|uniref:Uncharacterized protein n=1 Tax=Mycoplasmopsis cynos TaxID=171284 RepID=A0ABD8AIL5_9BACT|nr:hypothetical protein [Mycoplasmopsis cynos]MCU9935278.1 hypothetical protein [Mycoplasmopsis cynos]WQQ19875.1 hypothetical protein RRG46_03470 [Mycoplasmopsis cynos]